MLKYYNPAFLNIIFNYLYENYFKFQNIYMIKNWKSEQNSVIIFESSHFTTVSSTLFYTKS